MAADFLGLWTGVWAVDGSSIDWIRPGTNYEYLLRLAPLGNGVEGYLVMPDLNNGGLTGNVTGTLGSDYRLTLSGYTPAAGSDDASVKFDMMVWFSDGVLRGTVGYEAEGGWRRREVVLGTVVTGVRSAETSATFDGNWRGRYLVQTCEFIEWDRCYWGQVGETREVELVLSQAGSGVTGTFEPDYSRTQSPGYAYVINVSGPVMGNAIQLTGTSPYYPLNPNVTRRLLAFSATRDSVGRLTGTLTWQEDFVGNGPANLGVLHRLTRTGELSGVVQVSSMALQNAR